MRHYEMDLSNMKCTNKTLINLTNYLIFTIVIDLGYKSIANFQISL